MSKLNVSRSDDVPRSCCVSVRLEKDGAKGLSEEEMVRSVVWEKVDSSVDGWTDQKKVALEPGV